MIILIFIWWFVGVLGFIYWWTTENDLTGLSLLGSFCAGFMGPVTWICGYFIYSKDDFITKVFIKKRSE